MEQRQIETLSTNEIDVGEEEEEPLVEEVKAALKILNLKKISRTVEHPSKTFEFNGEASIKALHQLYCKNGKGGNVKDFNNYRTIALTAYVSKIILIIIFNRMKQKIEFELSDSQAGYRSTTIDYIDYKNAFDSVIRFISVYSKQWKDYASQSTKFH